MHRGYEDQVTDAVQVKNVMAGGIRMATRVAGGPNAGAYYLHGDHLVGLSALTDRMSHRTYSRSRPGLAGPVTLAAAAGLLGRTRQREAEHPFRSGAHKPRGSPQRWSG